MKKIITVTITISNEVKPINEMWDIKFEKDIIQKVNLPVFQFSTMSMNVAVTKLAYLVSRHPENYFKEIHIK